MQVVEFSVALVGITCLMFYKKYFSKLFGELSVNHFGDVVVCSCLLLLIKAPV